MLTDSVPIYQAFHLVTEGQNAGREIPVDNLFTNKNPGGFINNVGCFFPSISRWRKEVKSKIEKKQKEQNIIVNLKFRRVKLTK